MKWPTAQLGAVTKIVSGSTPKSGNPAFWGGDIPWATPTDLSGLATKELATTGRMITKAGLASCSAAMLPARSVLFSSRAPIGLVAINKDPLCTNQGFKSFVPDKARLSPDFLYWWLKCHRAALEHLGRGATFKEVSKSIIEAVEIPLPPLAEQKRIAAILDAADALRAKRREALAQLDALLQSSFLTLFGDPVTNQMGWPIRTIGELCEVKGGKRLPKGEDYSLTPTPFRYIRVTDLKDGAVNAEALVYLKPEVQAKISRYIVNTGDVIISIAGSIGLIAPVTKSLDGVNLTENAAKLVPRDRKIYDAGYLASLMRTPFAQKQIGSQIGQATIGKLALFRIEKLTVPLPPLPLQQKFAAIVESIERQKATQRAHLTELDALFAVLQHRAFRGEL